ncbi:putative glutathione S-transferase [Vibrio nigripulchritudo SOn1]|uniref:Glutathione S-transferase n=1 Tax=Vibrio nigripulchritudo SOn1 TaxID=1238450 RepID=A0AAV2VL79_9VIBR|nr:glutathione S-transferase family protein [Vibrio nigripulchritudo]CCO45464.1 putative glutathione S-transferase [Vibrio nigripulchritudo SOn1]
MITLYGRKTSFNVQKVLWYLEELGVEFSLTELGGRFGGLDEPEFVRLNPMKKVPVLVDDNPGFDSERVIWESHSILRYLAAEYGEVLTPFERSEYERWMDWSQVVFQPAFMGTFWGFYRMPAHKQNPEQIERDIQTCLKALETIEECLAEGFLAGKQLSLADICVGAVLYRLTEQGLEIPLPEKVNQWYLKLKQRSGYQKWVMSDFSELKAREDY